ncbi:hypothetical protein [Kineococcus glutinatus]
MRWEQLFDDLTGELVAEERRELEAEVADRARRELAAVALVDRLRAAQGGPGEPAVDVELHLGRERVLRGGVVDCAAQWVLLSVPREVGGSGRALVPLGAVIGVRGLPRRSRPARSPVADRRSLGSALRALAVARCPVQVLLRRGGVEGAGLLHGTLERIGADHVDVGEHPVGELPARAGRVTTVVLEDLAAVLDRS